MKRLAYILVALLPLFVSCAKWENSPGETKSGGTTGGQGEQERPVTPVKPEEFLKAERGVEYYRSRIDYEGTFGMPPEQMPRESVAPEEVEAVGKQMWSLWSQANAERLAESKLSLEGILKSMGLSGFSTKQFLGIEPVRDIPQGEKMKFEAFFKGLAPAGGYPMVINLHGGGKYPNESSAWSSDINTEQYSAEIELSRASSDAPTYHFIPRMPDDRRGNWHYAPEVVAFRKALQPSILAPMANPEKTYVMGISQGGYGAIHLGLLQPDYFAAIGPMDAAIGLGELVQNWRNLAVRLKVGELDTEHGRATYAYRLQDKLAELQQANFGEFRGEVIVEAGKMHGDLDYDGMGEWLERHTRVVYPKHLTYVYHNAAPSEGESGGFSRGVYYLGFVGLRASSPQDRLLFDVVHEGNAFRIETKAIRGRVKGELSLFVEGVDFSKPVVVTLHGKQVYDGLLRPNRGAMVESIALWGDPLRVFPSKVTISID